MKQAIFRPSYRRRRAYLTALRVMFSYLWLRWRSRLFGKSFYQKRIQQLNQRNAERIKHTLLDLQGLFIKFGQLISILSNILPPEFRTPLESLQDKVPARPPEEVRNTLQRELGKDPDLLFDAFDPTPIAAASIGQVHRARIGEDEVVIKVQHANIREIAEADLTIIRNLMRLVMRFYRVRGFEHLYGQLEQMIREELDYEREAIGMQLIGESLAAEPGYGIVVPEIFPAFTRKRVLVSRYHSGVVITNLEQLSIWELDREKLMERLLLSYCKMILLDGFYHADPHPGNILVNAEGKLILLDFGATAQLSPRMKAAIPKVIQAVIRDDDADMVEALQEMGLISKNRDAGRTAARFLETMREFLDTELELDNLQVKVNANSGSIVRLLNQLDLRALTQTFEIPKDWVLLNRTITLLGGLTNTVAPQLNPVGVVRPFIRKELVFSRRGLQDLVVNTLRTQLTAALSLPAETRTFLRSANRGNLEVQVPGIAAGFRLWYLLGQQFFWLIILLTGLWWVESHPETAVYGYIGMGLAAVFLLLTLWRGRKTFQKMRENGR